MVVILCKWFW